jgi:hypothetical protein
MLFASSVGPQMFAWFPAARFALISSSQIARSLESCFGSICRLSTRVHSPGSVAHPAAARHKNTANKLQPVRNPESLIVTFAAILLPIALNSAVAAHRDPIPPFRVRLSTARAAFLALRPCNVTRAIDRSGFSGKVCLRYLTSQRDSLANLADACVRSRCVRFGHTGLV